MLYVGIWVTAVTHSVVSAVKLSVDALETQCLWRGGRHWHRSLFLHGKIGKGYIVVGLLIVTELQ